MMYFTKMAPLFSLCALATACAQQAKTTAEQETMAADKAEHTHDEHGTVKPGADVRFSYDIKGALEAGQTGDVIVSIAEGYDDGVLFLTASGSDGLEVFGASSTMQFDMSDGGAHNWPISFQPQNDGVHYLNIMARTVSANGVEASRSYAIRLEVGDLPVAEKPVEGGVVVMEAEETIE